MIQLSPLSANPTKWSNTLKQFVGNLPTNCLSVFDNFVKLALKGLIITSDDPHEYFPFGSEKNLFESVNIRLPCEPKK